MLQLTKTVVKPRNVIYESKKTMDPFKDSFMNNLATSTDDSFESFQSKTLN